MSAADSIANVASALRALNDSSDPVSRSGIMSLSGLRREDAQRALDFLQHRQIVSQLSPREDRFVLDRDKEFLVYSFDKQVSVSSEGHRSVRVTGSLLPIRDGSRSRFVGSTVWKADMKAPRVRLGPVVRKSVIPHLKTGSFSFEKITSPNNDVKFQLNFEPPLSAGEQVDYGFYLWNRSHYAKTRAEAMHRFKDEWIREGLAVRDPTVRLNMEVKLPAGYGFQKSRAAKNVIFSGDGTLVSQGETLTNGLRESPTRLRLSIDNPELGNYFICWIPPEQPQVMSNKISCLSSFDSG
jgi:hypothetical protein